MRSSYQWGISVYCRDAEWNRLCKLRGIERLLSLMRKKWKREVMWMGFGGKGIDNGLLGRDQNRGLRERHCGDGIRVTGKQ